MKNKESKNIKSIAIEDMKASGLDVRLIINDTTIDGYAHRLILRMEYSPKSRPTKHYFEED